MAFTETELMQIDSLTNTLLMSIELERLKEKANRLEVQLNEELDRIKDLNEKYGKPQTL